MSVLQVGTLEPALRDAVADKYAPLLLPDGAGRASFLAAHADGHIARIESDGDVLVVHQHDRGQAIERHVLSQAPAGNGDRQHLGQDDPALQVVDLVIGTGLQFGGLAIMPFALLVLTVAAAEAAIGLAILVVFYRNRGSIAVEDINAMKG